MVEIKHMGHASFRLTGKSSVVYIDPFEMPKGGPANPLADIILITHSHFDHCSPDDIDRINGPDTVILCPSDCKSRLMGDVRVMKAFEKAEYKGVKVEAVPAYNIDKNYHPKTNGWLGYVVEIDGKRIYHAGDTDIIPEMKNLKGIDYALLPVGGTYTMNAEEAAAAAEIIKPKIAVPMHYGSIVGTEADAERFAELCRFKVELI